MRTVPKLKSRLVAFTGVFLFLLAAGTASSIDVSVSATVPGTPPEVPPTKVRFIGSAYPGSPVHFIMDGTSVATTQANPATAFDVELTVTPGSHTFSIYATDTNSIDGKAFQISLTLSEGSTTTVSGIFLAPSIDISDSQFNIGDTITIFGQTVPNSAVAVTVNSDPTVHQVTANGSGVYQSQFVAGNETLVAGAHTGNSKATAPTTQVSETSKLVAFGIGATSCGAGPSDLNCDGRVDLIDFSILLYYWNQTNPSLARADINSDGVVGIVDFSIMLYYWTG